MAAPPSQSGTSQGSQEAHVEKERTRMGNITSHVHHQQHDGSCMGLLVGGLHVDAYLCVP